MGIRDRLAEREHARIRDQYKIKEDLKIMEINTDDAKEEHLPTYLFMASTLRILKYLLKKGGHI